MKTNQKLFIDCEFNGFGGALISMALAASDGHNWYGILPLPAVLDPWVAQAVAADPVFADDLAGAFVVLVPLVTE